MQIVGDIDALGRVCDLLLYCCNLLIAFGYIYSLQPLVPPTCCWAPCAPSTVFVVHAPAKTLRVLFRCAAAIGIVEGVKDGLYRGLPSAQLGECN